jgi:hypothetical protein
MEEVSDVAIADGRRRLVTIYRESADRIDLL